MFNDTDIRELLQSDLNLRSVIHVCLALAYRNGGLVAVQAKFSEWGADSAKGAQAQSFVIMRRAWNLTHPNALLPE